MSLTIKAQKRDAFGKNASRRLRREDKVPAVLYGEGAPTVSLVLFRKDIVMILKSETGENTIFKVTFDSKAQDAMIKELQVDPTTDELLHADLIQISMDKAIRVAVPLLLLGEPVGVKTEGGFVDFMTREVEVECLPRDIPENIKLDISALHLHQSVKLGDVAPPPGVKFISDPGAVVVLVDVPHKEEEVAKPAEEAVVAEPTEPEVIKKERAEKEEEPEEEKKGKKEKEKEKGKD